MAEAEEKSYTVTYIIVGVFVAILLAVVLTWVWWRRGKGFTNANHRPVLVKDMVWQQGNQHLTVPKGTLVEDYYAQTQAAMMKTSDVQELLVKLGT